MFWLYSIVLALGLLAISPVLLLKDTQNGRYTRFLRERFGRIPKLEEAGAIWLHAVSVGEALAVERLIAMLREEFPERAIVLSVTTAAARGVIERRLPAQKLFYFPLDFRWTARRALRAVRPGLVLIVETEIWPNFLREAQAAGVPVAFINGRISGRSYARYRLVRRLMRRVLGGVTCWLMQTQTDAERCLDLGARPERVQVAGNLKFDLVPPEKRALLRLLADKFRQAGVDRVCVAGSTMEGEEPILLASFAAARERFPQALLILAPRHPQRFEAVAGLLAAAALPWTRRSRLESEGVIAGGVLLLDTLGELATVYRFADVAFVGGSLVPHGGHNLLEPAFYGAPIIFGPSMENFAAIAEEFLAARAAFRADSGPELQHMMLRLLENDRLREETGRNARLLLESKRGATARVVEVIRPLLRESGAGAVVPAGVP
ncbi:MAG TPA: 3-deoxy-D-manno-octulosonic acid transferase [Terriglobales bacterium]|nr:3-deoxy-D-manno-octulosonic acid transferase [Terriglobales bacterium]